MKGESGSTLPHPLKPSCVKIASSGRGWRSEACFSPRRPQPSEARGTLGRYFHAATLTTRVSEFTRRRFARRKTHISILSPVVHAVPAGAWFFDGTNSNDRRK